MSNGELILYTTEDGKTSIQLKAQEEKLLADKEDIALLEELRTKIQPSEIATARDIL